MAGQTALSNSRMVSKSFGACWILAILPGFFYKQSLGLSILFGRARKPAKLLKVQRQAALGPA